MLLLSNTLPLHQKGCSITVNYTWKSCRTQAMSKEEYLGKSKMQSGYKNKEPMALEDSGTYSYSKH